MINSFKNYLVEEEKTVYFTFGRMNPPTIGHENLMKKLSDKAGSNPYRVYLSQSQDKAKNPISYKDKVKFVRKMFPRYARAVMLTPKIKTFLDAASALYDEGYKNIVMVVGADRVNEMELRLKQYNGVKARHGFYNFARITVESAGERDPDGDGVEGASATKQRQYAKANDFIKFGQGVPKNVSNADAKALFNAVRAGMGLKETRDFTNHIKLEKVSTVREKYVQGDLFEVGDRVKILTDGTMATVKHLGSNYVIIEQNNKMKRVWLEAVKKIKKIEAFSAVDLVKKRIDQEKQTDAKRHDAMLDKARMQDTKNVNKATK